MEAERRRIGARIGALREHKAVTEGKEWSARRLASKARVSATTIGAIESGQQPRILDKTKEAIANALGWRDWDVMMGTDALVPTAAQASDKSRNVVDNSPQRPLNGGVVRVPSAQGQNATAWRQPSRNPPLARLLITQFMGVRMLSVHPQTEVSADALVTGDHIEVDGDVAIPESMAAGRTVQAVRVTGSCMEPEISAGDVVIIEMDRLPMDGEVVVVEYEGRTLVKRWWDDGETVFLQANRPTDSLPAVPKNELVVIGVVIGGVYEVVKQPPRWRRSA